MISAVITVPGNSPVCKTLGLKTSFLEGARVGVVQEGNRTKIELLLNEDYDGPPLTLKDGEPISPPRVGGGRKRGRRSCEPDDIIEISRGEGGDRQVLARVRTADVQKLIGAVLVWDGGVEWARRRWGIATDDKTMGFKSGGAHFTEKAAALTKLTLKKMYNSPDDEVDARYEVRERERNGARCTLHNLTPLAPPVPPARRSPARAQACKALATTLGHWDDMLDRKFSNNLLLIRAAFRMTRLLYAISQVSRAAPNSPPSCLRTRNPLRRASSYPARDR